MSRFDRRMPQSPAGAVPVGDLRALPPAEALAVLFLRDWCEGVTGRGRMASVMTGALGRGPGGVAAEAFGDLIGLIATGGRRPLMRHALGCTCIGADEAVFANLLAVAAAGEREDAMMIASLILPGDRLPLAARDAEIAGLAVARIALLNPQAPAASHTTLH